MATTPKNNKSKGTALTLTEFEAIQSLSEAGLTDAKIGSIMQRSPATVHYVKKSKDMEAYHAKTRAIAEHRKARKLQAVSDSQTAKENNQITPKLYIDDEVVPNELVTLLAPPSIEESLAAIADELKRLREAWEKPKAKGLFK